MKTYSVILTPHAKQGLLEISDYISQDNPIRAKSFIKELLSSVKNTLSTFPFSGRKAEEYRGEEEIRVIVYKNYLSYYRVLEEKRRVEILYIFNGKRNIDRIVEEL